MVCAVFPALITIADNALSRAAVVVATYWRAMNYNMAVMPMNATKVKRC
jgi:hypothetical protein